jgi:hypothetical protein
MQEMGTNKQKNSLAFSLQADYIDWDHHLGHATNFSFSSMEIVRQLQFIYYGAPSLTRGLICKLQMLQSSSARSFSGVSPADS